MQPDYQSLVNSFNQAWNEHDAQKVAEFFTDNGVVEVLPAPPNHQQNKWEGKEQILAWIQAQIPGFSVEVSNLQADGNNLTWDFQVGSDFFRHLGIEQSVGTIQAEVENNKLKSFILTFSPQTVAEMMQKMAPEQGGVI